MSSQLKKSNATFTTCSVVMSVYKKDNPVWLQAAIKSILNQTAVPDDFIIVRDGPVPDPITEVLRNYKERKNVTIIHLEQNVGAGEARNIGLTLAKNELVAIMDADDIALPDRLSLQLAAFNSCPELSIVGGQIAEFEDTPNNIVSYRRVPLHHEKIVSFSRRRSPFNNMCVCLRRTDALDAGGYKNCTRAEDYNLWLELIYRGKQTANLPNILCYVRINDASLRRRITLEQTVELFKLRYKYFHRNHIRLSDLLITNSVSLLLLLIPRKATKVIYKKVLRT